MEKFALIEKVQEFERPRVQEAATDAAFCTI
jgi:hypothetical protein